ncbi:MAG: hypothetical protein R3275_03750 [Saprospiraceae bacterium]|nr:hypothetical protein [Saprospiraceae bacterium]
MADLRKLLDLPSDLDEKSTRLLLKAIKDKNKEGFDYLEFLVSIDKLKKLDMDEATAMKSAYATASSFGLSKDALISSGHYYVSVLRNEYEDFKSALNRQIQKKIDGPIDKIREMEKAYNDIDDQIARLKKQKEVYRSQISDLKKKVEDSKTDLTEREERFNETFNQVKSAIERHITNINDQL